MPELWKETFSPIYHVDIPKNIVIKDLVDQYEEVKYPHGKVFNSMVKKIEKSKLARYFHYDDTTLCLGCHHNTPAGDKPPRCSICHGAPFNENHLHQPGIMASYHQQCMGCHQKMEVTKYLSCTSCHKERTKQPEASNGPQVQPKSLKKSSG